MRTIFLEDFENEVLNSPVCVLLKIGKNSCHLCRGLSQVFHELDLRYAGKVKFVDIDLDANRNIENIFEIDGVPTVIFIKNGNSVEVPYPDQPSVISGYGKEYLENYIERMLWQKND